MSNSASGGAVRIETGGILIRGLTVSDADGFRAMREDKLIYCFEPASLPELQGTAQEALLACRTRTLRKTGSASSAFLNEPPPASLPVLPSSMTTSPRERSFPSATD